MACSCHCAFAFEGGCFALECPECEEAFCGYCFHVALAGDSHTHTSGCEYNAFGLFGGHPTDIALQVANFERAQRSRRVRMLGEYVQELDQASKDRLLRELNPELRDYGLADEVL